MHFVPLMPDKHAVGHGVQAMQAARACTREQALNEFKLVRLTFVHLDFARESATRHAFPIFLLEDVKGAVLAGIRPYTIIKPDPWDNSVCNGTGDIVPNLFTSVRSEFHHDGPLVGREHFNIANASETCLIRGARREG